MYSDPAGVAFRLHGLSLLFGLVTAQDDQAINIVSLDRLGWKGIENFTRNSTTNLHSSHHRWRHHSVVQLAQVSERSNGNHRFVGMG